MSHDHMKPEVTVGIVVLNREWIIGEAIRSLLTQDYPSDKIHVIIVDGGSTDNTVEICTKMLEGSSVASFGIIVKPSTIPEARNICISKMKGSYLFFWDSDVIMGSRALSELVDAAERVHADVVSANVLTVYVKYPGEAWRLLEEAQAQAIGGELTQVAGVCMGATLVSRRVAEKVGFDPDLTVYEDADFSVRALKLGYKLFVHKGVIALDVNRAGDSKGDVFTDKPISELLRGLRKKARAKALTLSLNPSISTFIRYILRYKRFGFYLGYLPMLAFLLYGVVAKLSYAIILPISYILGYLIYQVIKRGFGKGLKVFIASFLLGLPLTSLMLFYIIVNDFRSHLKGLPIFKPLSTSNRL
ncbi:MAG: glycosyltransferase [Infirmifilum sp.]